MSKIFYIEITTKCNFNCPFCPSSKSKNHQNMKFDDFCEIINKIKEEASLVYFHVLGEPTLHPEFKEMVLYTKKQGIDVGITTNGFYLEKIDDDLLKIGIKKINISLQSQIGFDRIKTIDYLNKIVLFLKRKDFINSSLPINLRLWNNKGLDSIKDMNGFIENYLKDKILDFNNVRFSYDDEFNWPNETKDVELNSTCLGGKKQLAILNDGRVCLCCLDYLGKTEIGNIFKNDLSTILNSELYKSAIKGFNDSKPYFEICKKCDFRLRFL